MIHSFIHSSNSFIEFIELEFIELVLKYHCEWNKMDLFLCWSEVKNVSVLQQLVIWAMVLSADASLLLVSYWPSRYYAQVFLFFTPTSPLLSRVSICIRQTWKGRSMCNEHWQNVGSSRETCWYKLEEKLERWEGVQTERRMRGWGREADRSDDRLFFTCFSPDTSCYIKSNLDTEEI